MARIRTIKPEWAENERLAACSDSARVLSVALIILADDHGNGRASIGYLAGQVWHEHDDARDRVRSAFQELAAIEYVVPYTVNGQKYFHIPGWKRHQLIRNPSLPRVPGPDCAESAESLRRHYADTNSGPLPLPLPGSLPLPPGEPGEIDSAPRKFNLEAVYQAYPRKAGRKKGLDRLKARIRTEADYQAVLSACQRMSELWAGADTKYCPHFSTFVNQERWLDAELPEPSVQVNGSAAKPAATGTETDNWQTWR